MTCLTAMERISVNHLCTIRHCDCAGASGRAIEQCLSIGGIEQPVPRGIIPVSLSHGDGNEIICPRELTAFIRRGEYQRCSRTEALQSRGQRDTGQASADTQRIVTDTDDTLRNLNVCEPIALIESKVSKRLQLTGQTAGKLYRS